MQATRRHRLSAAWIALIAILMASFAPSVSAWRGIERGGVWGLICSASDGASIAGGVANSDRPDSRSDSRSGEQPGLAHLFAHCPYCALHANLAPPPAPQATVALRPVTFRARPIAFLDVPRSVWVWSSARPRAPPASA